MPQLAYS